MPLNRLRSRLNTLGFGAVLGLMLLGTHPANGQSSTPPDINPRGFLPDSLIQHSETDDIDLVSGNLVYQVPMYKFPAAPGSVPSGIGLVYNSSLYTFSSMTETESGFSPVSVSSIYQDAAGGGWQYSFQYSLLVEQSTTQCSGNIGGALFRISALFPDGSRHVLHLAGTQGQTLNTHLYNDGNGFTYVDPYNGVGYCGQGSLAGTTLVYYTDDGTYMRAEITVPASGSSAPAPWTFFLPDGMQASGTGLPGTTGAVNVSQITDRNGNTLTLNVSQPDNLFEPQFTITDQHGRSVTLVPTLGTGGIVEQDVLTAPGFGKNLTWTVQWGSYFSYVSSTPPEQLYYVDGPCTILGGCTAQPGGVFVSNVQLPSVNGEVLQYQFTYDVGTATTTGWAELNSVSTPYGATVTYTYSEEGPARAQYFENARVASKKLAWTDPLGAPRTQQWTFTASGTLDVSYPQTLAVNAPDNGTTTYTFCNLPTQGNTAGVKPEICTIAQPNGDTTQRTWHRNCPYGIWAVPDSETPGNPYVGTEKRTIGNGALTSTRNYTYDRNGNSLSTVEYDWNASSPTRTTTNTFAVVPGAAEGDACNANYYNSDETTAYWNHQSGGVLDARTSTLVTDSGGNESLENLTYDNPITTANVITEMRWRSQDSSGNPLPYSNPLTAANSATITHTYDVGGGLLTTIDADGFKTVYALNQWCPFTASDGNTHYSNPTSVTVAYGTSLQRSTTESWDCSSGFLTKSIDPNNVATGRTYDSIGRLLQVDEASGQPSERETNSTYAETNTSASSSTPLVVDTSHDLNTTGESLPNSNMITGGVQKVETFDQRGQLYLTQTSDSASACPPGNTTCISVQSLPKLSVSGDGVTYEAVSNPYRTTSDVSAGWTRKIYDQLQRLVELDHFSGATPPYPWNASNTSPASSATISYSSNLTTTIDEAGKEKITAQDAFGRLTSVTEDPNGLNYPTTYMYDFANNLKTVTQSSETRTFTYDSLGHLISATSPENGTLTYAYDPNGNMVIKKDATNQLSITYDALNRVILKSYSDSTPWATYCYDGLTPTGCSSAPTGSGNLLMNRLTMVTNGVSSSLLTAYDAVGNVLNSQQATGSQNFCPSGKTPPCQFIYTYNKLGGVLSTTYPSGRVVTTTYDAAGRPASLQNGSTQASYASSVGYAPNESINSITLGNNLLETTTFNTRFQPTQVQAGSLLTLGYSYGTSNNNGNIQTQSIFDGTTTRNQSFSYDGVNRLTGATETGNWAQTYVYDAYGNRGLLSSSNDPSTGVSLLLDATTASTTSVPFGTNNRWNAGGAGYDARGNLTGASASPNSFTATYDAENRQIQTVGNIGGTTTTVNYAYDGDGKRVTKAVTGGATTTYLYDAKGDLSAEYSTATNLDSGTQYLTSDPLGSTRLITTGTTTPAKSGCSDYLPFGQEIPATWGARNCTPDPSETIKFTRKERDAETGLDFFEARYFSSAQGRFTSPDEFKGGGLDDPLTDKSEETIGPLPYADITDPQTLNKYGYVRNNPLRYVDPDGHDFSDYLQGAINAFTSDNAFGAGRMSADNSDFKLGQAVGDAVATVTGTAEALFGGGEAVVTSPAALTGVGALVPAAGVAVAAHGAATAVVASTQLAKSARGELDKSPTGKGSVPPNQRDPKRTLTPKEISEKLAEQGGKCANCGKEIGKGEGRAHHYPERHADGARTTKETNKIVCDDCHKELHTP